MCEQRVGKRLAAPGAGGMRRWRGRDTILVSMLCDHFIFPEVIQPFRQADLFGCAQAGRAARRRFRHAAAGLERFMPSQCVRWCSSCMSNLQPQ